MKKKYNYHEKKKFWYRTWMGYCPSELKAGLGAGRAGAGRAGTVQAAWAREHGTGVRGLARGVRTGAGSSDGRGARDQQGTDTRGRAAGAGAWSRRARGKQMRGARGARRGRACSRRLGVLAGQLGQVGAQCTWLSSDSVFLDPVRLGIFPESLNEHCSL